MSSKIKGKDLSYDNSLPPFLQRLHAQKGGDADRHERAIARPKRAKDVDDDDGPTVVDESGETLSKDEVEKLTIGAADGATSKIKTERVGGEPRKDEMQSKTSEQKITTGAPKKRKAAKIVGDETSSPGLRGGANEAMQKEAKKSKKKSKAVKLAFDDDEDT